jgi:rubrerythrin
MSEKFSVKEVVEQAVRAEQLGYRFYTEMAERFRENARLHDLFATLAGKELIHERNFKELHDCVGDAEPEGWEDVSEYMRAFVESEFFLGSGKALTSMERIRTPAEAVNFAIGFEKETLLYFLGVRDAVKQREIVDEIINEERSHVMWLNRFKERFL